MRGALAIGLLSALAAAGVSAVPEAITIGAPLPDSGDIIVHLLGRPVGRERFMVRQEGNERVLTSSLDFVDRGTRVQLEASLTTNADLTPTHFRALGASYRFVRVDAEVSLVGRRVHVRNGGVTSRLAAPPFFFPARGYAPLAGRALLVQYWERHGRPAHIALLPSDAPASIRVLFRGVDTITVNARPQVARRYAVDGVVWGREAVWIDERDRFVAVITRVHILPLTAVREDLIAALPQLQASALRDRMTDAAQFAEALPPVAEGSFALVGGRVVDGTGRPPLNDATVIIQSGRISAVGPRADVEIPDGMQVVDARGKTLIPGLWDMHGHVSQLEWAPAYLAAGVTTVRDVGGELPFLTALRDTLETTRGIGPRLLLAGLVDGAVPNAFGTTTAATADEGIAVVNSFLAQGFSQVKLYGSVSPSVVRAITQRAHAMGMTVTGHIPTALGLRGGVDAGMDGVEHLPVRGPASSPDAHLLIDLLARHHTVVTPTLAWNELLGRAPGTRIASFEPGITGAAAPLALNYESVRNDIDAAGAAEARRQGLEMVRALHVAGVPVVAGTDGGVPGHSLLRELELFVAAGFTPMGAIRAATIVPATTLGLQDETGTIEVGKWASLVVLDRDPLVNIHNIRTGRWVVVRGRMYACRALWQLAGFTAPRP
ncbi:MAG: amidohydrolase family protein [Gemmatimonadaceae bacterium]